MVLSLPGTSTRFWKNIIALLSSLFSGSLALFFQKNLASPLPRGEANSLLSKVARPHYG
jgi:hypothetical protein